MEAVLQALDQQIAAHEQLLAVSEAKKAAIIQNDVEQVMQLTQKESRLAKEMAQLEEQRHAAVRTYMSGRSMYMTVDVTVSTLVRMVSRAEDKTALLDRQQQLLRLLEQLKTATRLNQELIEQSLAYLDFSMDVLVGSDGDQTVYVHPQMELNRQQRNRMFDRKA